MKKTVSLLSLILLASCASTKEDLKAKEDLKKIWSKHFTQDFNETKTLEVFVATNRLQNAKNFECEENSFDVLADKNLHFGICKISAPKNHAIGEIEIARDAGNSFNNYFKVVGAQPLNEEDLIKLLKNSKNTPLVFVHGFNVKYQEAVLRATQIAYDLKYQGPVVLFTWPAGASNSFFDNAMVNKTYEKNRVNAEESKAAIISFFTKLREEKIKINLLVHSMGHQVVLPALSEIGEKNRDKTFINELILNAPDFDSSQFKNIAKNVKATSDHITLYCSENDKAIKASEIINKGARLGTCVASPDLDVVNVGQIDNSTIGLGHGYYSSRPILTDVFQVLLGVDADKRLFIKKADNASAGFFLRN